MGEEFDESVDTSSFDDVSSDFSDTDSFSEPMDVGDIMDDVPSEPIETYDLDSIDSSFEENISSSETSDVADLLDDSAVEIPSDETVSDVQDSSFMDSNDLPTEIEDFEQDAASDIADLMDEASIDDTPNDITESTEVSEVSEDNIESIMDDTEPLSDIIEESDDMISSDMDDNVAEIDSLMDTENPVQQDDIEDIADVSDDSPEDVSAILDSNDIDDTVTDGEINDNLSETTDLSNVSIEETEDAIPDESQESLEEVSVDDNAEDADIDNRDDSQQITEDIDDVTEESDISDDSPLDSNASAYDQLAAYYSSHNYGQQDYAEYSQDPEWQELNNAYLQEIGQDPIDYGNDSTTESQIETIETPSDYSEPSVTDTEAVNDIQIDVDDAAEESGTGPALTRDATEQWESGNRAIDDNIEAMRDDLRDKGLEDGPEMESIVMAERARMQEELERNIRGDFSNPYQKPDFGELLQERQESEELAANGQDVLQEMPEETPNITDLPNEINYDEVFEGLDDYDFDGIDYATDTERLDSSLENFDSSTWDSLSLDEQKAAMTDLADYVKDVIGFDNPPEIVYYNNPVDGDYGGYSPGSNTLEVNEYMLYNNEEAADTVAHELWHAYQHQRANNPQSAKDYQYQYGFDNYIRPEDDFAGYQDQLVEAEARAFAQQFKDRLNIKGRRI